MAPMETVDNLGSVVISESEDKAEWIIKSAQEMSNKYIDEATQKATENAEKIITQGRYTGEKEKQKILSTAEMEVKRMVLNCRESLIDEAFALAREKFEAFKKTKEYTNILQKHIISSIGELEGNSFTVIASKHDSFSLTDSVVNKVKKETGKKGLKLELQEVDEDIGGVIVREKNGKVSIDNTFDSMLNRIKNEIRAKVSEILFD
jgi:V/A-type H+-transporting ATPase subunit E